MAVRIETDMVVTITYRLTDKDGRLLEERTPDHPYSYVQGKGQVVGPVERAVEGKTIGFQTELSLTPRESYGEYDPTLVADLPRAHFPMTTPVTVGMKFNTVGPEGQPMIIRVIEEAEEFVTVDGNHPLAGLDLIFELKVLDLRPATAEELESGRVGETIPVQSGSDSIH